MRGDWQSSSYGPITTSVWNQNQAHKLSAGARPAVSRSRILIWKQNVANHFDAHLRGLGLFTSSTQSFLLAQSPAYNPHCFPRVSHSIRPQSPHLLHNRRTLRLLDPRPRNPRSRFQFRFDRMRCISSDSPAPTLDWNDPVSCSVVGNGDNGSVEVDT